MEGAETIFALATPPGRSAVAVVRLSGPDSGAALKTLTGGLGRPRMARLATVRGEDGAGIDQALTLWFPAPNSETGEDQAEFQLHGGPAVIAALIAELAGMGLRQARPGEFARRAFENGKLDLTQAEGLADLIEAETDSQRAQALSQMTGALRRLYEDWRTRLVDISALIEAEIDFPDESDAPDAAAARVRPMLNGLRSEIEAHLNDGARGERIRDGFVAALIGPPNAGKSSILNRLARREAAIVTEIPGTTRDIVEIALHLGPYAAVIADTAGLRETGDRIEAEGVRRALARADSADLRVGVVELGDSAGAEMLTMQLRPGDIRLVNKSDLGGEGFGGADMPPAPEGVADLSVSAETGAGFARFETVLGDAVAERLSAREAPSLTRARHREAESRAVAALTRAESALDEGAELAGEDVRVAIRALEELTGRVDVEDVLDRVFSQFCIGK